MLDPKNFCFNGQITNRKNVISQLNLPSNASDFELTKAAYVKWALALNLHLAGDYVIVLPLEDTQHVFLCLSAFSSHQLFYRNDKHTINISNTLADFSHQANVDILAINQLLHWRYICTPNTLFKHVSALSNGQSIICQLGSNPAVILQKKLSLFEKLNAAQSENDNAEIGNITNSELSFFNIFNHIIIII